MFVTINTAGKCPDVNVDRGLWLGGFVTQLVTPPTSLPPPGSQLIY